MNKSNGLQTGKAAKQVAVAGKASVSDYVVIICKRMMTVLIGFSRQSTIHSLSHLAQARNIKQRMFWMIIGLSASVGFMINLVQIVEKYYESPVLTNVFHDHNTFVFPDITFCLVNPVYFPPNGTRQYRDLERQFAHYHKFRSSTNLKARQEALSFMAYKNYSLDIDLSDFLFIQPEVHYGHPAWSAIFICVYMQSGCSWSHFEVRHVWPYGNCFTLNVSRISKHSRRDVSNMIKNAWRPDFKIIVNKGLTPTAKFNVDPFNNLNTPSGVLVMVHEADTYPYPDEGFIVDSYTQIDLKITTKVHLDVNNKCDKHRSTYKYYDFRTKQSATFAGRQPDCVFDMIQSQIGNRCSCLLQNMPVATRFRHLPFCLAMKVNKTIVNQDRDLNACIKSSFKFIDQSAINKKCHRDLCSHPSYTTVVSHSKYPAVKERQTQSLWLEKLLNLENHQLAHYNKSDLYLIALKSELVQRYNITSLAHAIRIQKRHQIHFLDESFVDRNFMQIRVVPSSLFMDHIEETLEYTLSRLLGDIGGCIGLWIGASLITIFEIVDLLFRFGDLLSSYRYQPAVSKWDKPTGNNNNSGSTNSANRMLNKFKYLSEEETGDLEDEINLTLLQPISIIKGSRSYFYKHMRLEDS